MKTFDYKNIEIKNVKIIEITIAEEKKVIAKQILVDLPEWFGIPEHTENYIEKSSEMPFLAIYIDDIVAGFASLKKTAECTSEIFCMGVIKKYHRKGLGQQLYYKLERLAKKLGYKYIQVKTVEKGRYDEYDKTNAFYESVGFCELEVFPKLWDEWNPCQIYIKAI